MSASAKVRPPSGGYKRQRNQFKAWVLWQLQLRGADLPERPSYRQIQVALERYMVPRP